MATPNYFKQEKDRLLYGNYDGVADPIVTGFAKNESWNIENIERNSDETDASFDFLVGNIRKFSLSKVVGIFTDDGTGVIEQTDVNDALDFFLIP